MTLKTIAFRNLLRRKGKAAFVLAGLAIGVATVVTVITLIEAVTADITHKLDQYGANILIVPKTESLTLSYGGLSLGGVSFDMQEIRQEELARIKTIKNAANVAAVGPMTLGAVQIAAKSALLAGVDLQAARTLKPWWNVTGSVPKEQEILFGADAARVFGVAPGSRVEINGQSLAVAGVLQSTGSQDDQLLFAPLATAQRLLGKAGKVSMVEVAALCTACPIEDMVKQISEALPEANVMAVQQVVKSRMHSLEQFRALSYGISGVVILVGSLVVLVTMMASVRERTEEIGIFRAIGFRQRHIMQIIFLEAFVISLLAGAFGYLIGLGATKIAVQFFATDHHGIAVPFNSSVALGAFALAIITGLLASAYPALLAAKLDPNDALRAL